MKKENNTQEGCLDILGEPIMTNDYVAYSKVDHRALFLSKVIGWTPKRIKVSELDKDYNASEYSTNLEHPNTRFIKIPKIMIMRLKMGLDLSEIDVDKESE